MSDFLKPGTSDSDYIVDDAKSFEEWFDNDPDGWVVAVFEEAMMMQAETKPVEMAVIYVLSSFQFSERDSRLRKTWIDMFDFWSNNLDQESLEQLDIYYQKWLGEQ